MRSSSAAASATERTPIPISRRHCSSIRHTAIVPLAVGETVGAVLILSRRSDRPFVPHELEGLQQVGPLAVLALRNARLVDEVRSAQRRGLDALTQMSRHMASSVEPATYFEKMSETVAGLVSAEHAGFWQLTGDELIPLHQPGTPVEHGDAVQAATRGTRRPGRQGPGSTPALR